MKIVTFSERFWPEGSGGELATYLILKLLASTGDFEVEVYTGTEKPAKIQSVSIRVVEFLKATNKVQLFLNIFANRHYVEKAVRMADAVYIPRFSYPIILLAKKYSKRVIVHLHGYQPVSYTSVVLSEEVEKPLSDFKRTLMLESRTGNTLRAVASALATPLTRVIRKWVGMADRIICVSRRHEEILLKLAPEYRGKTIVIYNPPPEVPEIEKDLSEKPTLLYTGGDSYVKGFHVLLEALRTLGKRKQTNFRLVLTNKYRQRSLRIIENLKKKYELNIKVLGRISYKELIKLHSEAWALIFPSIWEEPLPYAVTEALFLGTMPISSRVGGIMELVKDTVAEDFTFTSGDGLELSEKIENITLMSEHRVRAISSELQTNAISKLNPGKSVRYLVDLLMT